MQLQPFDHLVDQLALGMEHQSGEIESLDHARSVIVSGHSLPRRPSLSGFADQSHMTRQFKQAFGLTPGYWQAIRH